METQINSLETRIEKMQERFNKDLEEIKRPPQTQQYNQDEETEEYSAGKGTGELPTKQKRKK